MGHFVIFDRSMIPDPAALLLSIPFGETLETVTSARYAWDNTLRGKEPFVIIQWTLDGEGVFEFEGESRPVRAGEALIAIVPERSSYRFPKNGAEPWKFAWLNCYGALGVSLFRQFRSLFGAVVALPIGSAAGVTFQELIELAKARKFVDSHEASLACYGFLMEWTRQLTRPLRQVADPVQLALALCASRFREPLGVKELAAETGLSREHFTRIFTERTGKSPARHLRDLRVAAAQQMLRRQGFVLKEVALRCGFPSVRSLQRALEAE